MAIFFQKITIKCNTTLRIKSCTNMTLCHWQSAPWLSTTTQYLPQQELRVQVEFFSTFRLLNTTTTMQFQIQHNINSFSKKVHKVYHVHSWMKLCYQVQLLLIIWCTIWKTAQCWNVFWFWYHYRQHLSLLVSQKSSNTLIKISYVIPHTTY